MENSQGVIFNIQKFSLNDGPGIRTVVFLKGCPLSCRWCSNPESQLAKVQILWDSRNCLHCGHCARTNSINASLKMLLSFSVVSLFLSNLKVLFKDRYVTPAPCNRTRSGSGAPSHASRFRNSFRSPHARSPRCRARLSGSGLRPHRSRDPRRSYPRTAA